MCVIDKKMAAILSNYVVFRNLRKTQIIETAKSINTIILDNINHNVLKIINMSNPIRVCIISGNCSHIISLVANNLNYEIFGTDLEFINGKCSGKMLCFYNNKTKASLMKQLVKNLNDYNIIAIGNNYVDDIEMLKLANKKYIVNPSDSFKARIKNLEYIIV